MNKTFNLAMLGVIFLFSFILQEIPSSFVVQKVIPEWPFILMLFFVGHGDKNNYSLFIAFFIGLIQDVFMDTPFGLNAFIYVLSSYTIIILLSRNKSMNIISQASLVSFLVLSKCLIILIYNTISYGEANNYWSLLSVFLSFFAWIVIYYLFLILSL